MKEGRKKEKYTLIPLDKEYIGISEQLLLNLEYRMNSGNAC
jgi:hypothetical protein